MFKWIQHLEKLLLASNCAISTTYIYNSYNFLTLFWEKIIGKMCLDFNLNFLLYTIAFYHSLAVVLEQKDTQKMKHLLLS
jgi:hypothetical protein